MYCVVHVIMLGKRTGWAPQVPLDAHSHSCASGHLAKPASVDDDEDRRSSMPTVPADSHFQVALLPMQDMRI
jgi:hypothetical protein